MKQGTRAAILSGGMIAGVLDILDPLIFFYFYRGIAPIRILQSIASGLLGPEAFRGGVPAAALGLGLHFLIAFTAACVYCLSALRLPLLLRRPFLCGPLYGLAVYVFMNSVVLPLSAFRNAPPTIPVLINSLFAHAFLVGLPIALIARRSMMR